MAKKTTIDLRTYLDASWAKRYERFLRKDAGASLARHQNMRSRFGVEQTTVRSMPTGAEDRTDGPVAVFNAWAAKQSALWATPAALHGLNSVTTFEPVHSKLARSLQRHWEKEVERIKRERNGRPVLNAKGVPKKVCPTLALGQTYKLLDLFFRWMWLDKRGDAPAEKTLVHAHTPLDRKSLHVLSDTFSGILLAPKFTMGMVVRQEQYVFCQDLVQVVCEEVGGTPLLFDLFCWDDPQANSLYGTLRD